MLLGWNEVRIWWIPVSQDMGTVVGVILKTVGAARGLLYLNSNFDPMFPKISLSSSGGEFPLQLEGGIDDLFSGHTDETKVEPHLTPSSSWSRQDLVMNKTQGPTLLYFVASLEH